ncbi:MAG: hypothetical protein QM817_25175 [Archangium sp.]
MLALMVVLAAAPSVKVRYLETGDGVLRVMEHARGAKADLELARASQKCPVERSAWSEKADRVLVSSACGLLLLELGRKGAKTFPAPVAGPVERTQLEFTLDGGVLAFVDLSAEVKAFEWKNNAWVEIEKSEPTRGLDSIDALAFMDMKARARVLPRATSLNAIVDPGNSTSETKRDATAAELKALPKLGEGFSWEVHGDEKQPWAATVSGTDACFQSPPVVVRVGAKWNTVLGSGDCVRAVRRGAALLLESDELVVLVTLGTAEREQLKDNGFHHVLVSEGPTFVQ